MAKMGRPSALNKQLKEIACRLAKEPGMTIAKVAAHLGVGRTTLFLYLQKDKDFLNAFNDALTMADDLVEISLYRKATGYTHPEEKIFYDGDRGKVVRAKTLKHYAPSETAGMFWLKNRQPDRWRDKPEDDDSSDKPIKISVDEQDL